MKLWVILYTAKFDKKWQCDSVHKSQDVAQAKLVYERLERPEWQFEMAEVEVPQVDA